MNTTAQNRRDFLSFMGRSGAAAVTLPWLAQCASSTPQGERPHLPFRSIETSNADELRLADGLKYEIILRWGQELNLKKQKFGYNPDYIAFIPIKKGTTDEGLMWVNHEYHDPFAIHGWTGKTPHTRAQIDQERKEVGGSIVHLKKNKQGEWHLVENSKFNRRLDATTPIPLISERAIEGKRTAIGTLGNCAGGVTPWGTILTCEENYQHFYGEVSFKNGKRELLPSDEPYLDWSSEYRLPPEHYGWVVEVNLRTGKAKKLTALGRFSHECATTQIAPDGRTVVYSGDDCADEHLYKFISARPGNLEHGELFVADTKAGRWLSLDRNKNPKLKGAFKDQTELLIRAREAAKIVGATPLNRPEDIEIDPLSGALFISLTMNPKKGDEFGSLMRLMEKDKNPLSMEFEASQYLAGGYENGFANPDNLAFDAHGGLWLCTDMSDKKMLTGDFKPFGNNGLYYIPTQGHFAGQAMRIATGPVGSELTGLCFSPDGQTLFLSVQHPGEQGRGLGLSSSHWPDGGESLARPAVVAISGPTLSKLNPKLL